MTEKIKIVLVKRKKTTAGLASILGCSSTNIYNKMKRDNFSEKELIEIGNALDCDFVEQFKMRDTGETL